MVSCSQKSEDEIIVTSLDQINGTWEWESTCGGFVGTCGYSSISHYAMIEFTSNSQFIETHNDTVYFTAHFDLIKTDSPSGFLVFHKKESEDVLSKIPISIINNKLCISYGELYSTYKKIK